MPDATLHEPSFADLLSALADAPDLDGERRRHWLCSVRRIARWLDRPLDLLPARWTGVRVMVAQLHHVPLGVTAKTLANHRANLAAALRWFARIEDVPRRGAPLSPAWAILAAAIPDRHHRARLLGFMRFCSARAIAPGQADEAALDAYLDYRGRFTRLKVGPAARRSIARWWNAAAVLPGWPSVRLREPPAPGRSVYPAEEDLPPGLREDLDRYLAGLAKSRRSARGLRQAPSKPGTIRTRKAELMAFIRKAVACGIGLDRLTGLDALLQPDVVETVIDAYWRENGTEPATYTIELAGKLLSLARTLEGVGAAEIERLEEIRADLETYRRSDLTEKNLALVRGVLAKGVWSRVVALPGQAMARARGLAHSPVKAALSAQIAVAIAILVFAPIRLGNLTRIRIGETLIRPEGPAGPWRLIFPDYDVKNRVRLEFALDGEPSRLIDEYLDQHRHVLARGHAEPWLFPGEAGSFKTPSMFSEQIGEAVWDAVGLRITAHQFRHAAAAIILQADPGNYEFVRRVLGHKNLMTTTRFYIGLETLQATELYGRIVRERLAFAED